MSTLKVNKIEHTSTTAGGVSLDSSGNVTLPANTKVGTQNLPSAGPLSNRNLVINGAMQVAQRGTSTTAAGYLLDRFYYSTSGATGTYSQENFTIGQTDVPGADKYLKLDITTGDNNSGIFHKVEAKNAFSAIGKKVTLSYYAKGTSPTDGLQVGIVWYDGSTSSSRADTTVTLTSSWVKYTHTFDVPSISGLTLTNAAAYLEVHWQQASTDTGTAAYQLQLAQVQLEVGSVATPFEHRSYGDELRKCQRYFQGYDGRTAASRAAIRYDNFDTDTAGDIATVTLIGAGTVFDADDVRIVGTFSVPMRDRPTITSSDIRVATANGYYNSTTIVEGNNSTIYGLSIRVDNDGGMTGAQCSHLFIKGNGYLFFDAEL